MANSLVATKLMPPWAHHPAVPRPQLVARLRAGLAGPLTLLCAPAGFGKTSLVLQSLDGYAAAVAWLSLEPDDSAPTRFAHYLLAAITRAAPTLAPALAPLLGSSPLDIRATMATLINLLSAREDPLVLVLEDYHALDAPAVDEALSWLLVHPPPALRLLITSRDDPQLPLARLRARGWFAELRGADLRFSPAEGAALVRHLTGRPLSAAQVEALVDRTEGWAAGLQLASLALRDSPDVDGMIASLRGTHRFILDYLTDEVLLAQPPEIQQFLLQTSILDRLCGELCDCVAGIEKSELRREKGAVAAEQGSDLSGTSLFSIHNSQLVLQHLERANLFLVPLDAERRWYRYHALFADLLRARLAATAGDTAALHRRAAGWFAAAIPVHGQVMLAPAMHHALEGGDHEGAAGLIEAHGAALNGRGEQASMARWLERLPLDLFARRPELCLREAWMRTLIGQHAAAEARMRDAEQALAAVAQEASAQDDRCIRISGNVEAISAYLSYARGDNAATVTHGQAALRMLPAASTVVRTATHVIVGAGALDSDQCALAEEHLRAAIHGGQTAGNPYAALSAQGTLGILLLRQGRLDAAEPLLRAALDAHRDVAGAPLPIAGDLCNQLGQVLHERDNLAGAAALLEQGLRCGELVANGWTIQLAGLSLAWTYAVQGTWAAAHALLNALEDLAPRMTPVVEVDLTRTLRARIQLAQDNLPAVEAWLEQNPARPGGYRVRDLPIAMTRARALVAFGRGGEAVALLEPLLAAARAAGRAGQQVQLQVVYALALQADGKRAQAAETLQDALALGAACGHVRSFLDEGPAVAALLEAQSAKRKAQSDPLQRSSADLLRAMRGSQTTPADGESTALRSTALPLYRLAEPLTPRELELLRLLDAGLSNQAIAERLVLTVGTIKWHLNHLYAKLAIRGRTAALARARALGLLP